MKWISRLFGFNKAPRCPLQHYKEAGFPVPENMKEVFRFRPADAKKDYLDNYVIFECSGCGNRSYMHGGPILPQGVVEAVDGFIDHQISVEELIERLGTHGYSPRAR